MTNPPPVVHLIDGSGYIFRAYYAIRRLSTSKGEPTNAVYGFTTMLQKMLADEKPTHLAIAFDTKVPTFRAAIYPDYKAHRPPPPEDLIPQFARIKEVVESFKIPAFAVEGFEADDILATLAHRAVTRGFDVRIVTGDKDLMQLVDDRITLFDPMKGKHIGIDEVVERFGVPPPRVVEVLALAGDATDNVPGVEGVGEKTATKLLRDCPNLDALIARAKQGQVPGKVGERIAKSEDDIRVSLRLVTLDDQVPLDATIESLRYHGPNLDTQRALFETLEFRRLVPSAPSGEVRGPGAHETEHRFSPENYRVIREHADLQDLRAAIGQTKHVALAARFSSARMADAELWGLALCARGGFAHYIPLRADSRSDKGHATFASAQVVDALGGIFADPAIRKIGVSLKPLVAYFSRFGVRMRGIAMDGALASYLADPDDGPHDVRTIARRFLSFLPKDEDDLLGRGRARRDFHDLSNEEAMAWLGEEADLALQTVAPAETALKAAGVERVYSDIELPLISVLADIELCGVRIDVPQLARMSHVFESEIARLEKECHAHAGQTFNVDSPKQLQKVLYEDLGLRIVKRTKTGPSTDASALDSLVDEHPLPQAILDYRHLQKLKTTYVDALPRMVSPATGRVHTVMNQTVAATGRLSSTDPNLQNIPIRSELGRQLRAVFVAEPGRVLVSADYSQIELRILAHMSDDPVLCEAFKNGLDVHTQTASVLFGVAAQRVTKEQRAQAKTVNFGVLYGMGPMRLARQLGISRKEASDFIDGYFVHQPGVRRTMEATLSRAREEGCVRTLFGRRRLVRDIQSKNRVDRMAAERMAINTPIQGTAADLIKIAMIRVHERLLREHPESKLILQVHDELLLECPENKAKVVADLVRREMAEAHPLKVPLVVDARWGRTWADAHQG